MGVRYSSHIVNQSTEMIKVVLIERPELYTTQVIAAGKNVVIPTSSKRLTLRVFSRSNDTWRENPEASYTAVRGTSFIVDYGADGKLQIWRSVYGEIHKKNEGPGWY